MSDFPEIPTTENPSHPEPAPRRSRWKGVLFAIKAVEIRLRFIAVLVGIGLLIGYWDTLRNYWDKWTRPSSGAVAAAGSSEEFYCPMHPKVVRDTLDPDGTVPECPICGMPLSKRQKGEAPELPPGVLSRAQFSPERVQLAGIRTVPVEYRPLVKDLRTVGWVEYDESRLSKVVTRVDGYVEKLFVNKTFEPVEAGAPLAELYSPELFSASQELLLAHKRNLADLARSGREKLRLLGVSEQEIDQLLEEGEAQSRVTIRSPQKGDVIAKYVVEGSRVEEGMTLLEVADLSVVWIEADVYEKDVRFLKVGQPIEATVESVPGEVFEGTVTLIHPIVERETRTNRVRFELPNPEQLLRPGMYATVQVQRPVAELEPSATQIARRTAVPEGDDVALLAAWQQTCPVTGLDLGSMGPPVEVEIGGEKILLCCNGCVEPIEDNPDEYLKKLAPPPEDQVLAIPRESVIDTGSKHVVYVEREPGLFEGVEVKLGPRTGEYYPVISGLLPGDRIAGAGAFLIDAETRLNPAAASTYFGASGQSHEGHSTPPATRSPSSQGTSEPAASTKPRTLSPKHLQQIALLDPADQEAAKKQVLCPITDLPLGSMGVPIKKAVDGETLFLCCEGCEGEVEKNPQDALRKARGEEPVRK